MKAALNATFNFSDSTDVHAFPNPNLMLTSRDFYSMLARPAYLTPRFIIVRNPFARLLSAYLSKYHFGYAHVPLSGHTGNVTFADMVAHMHARWVVDGDKYLSSLDPHFRPLHFSCGIELGLGYDFYLPLENLDDWATDFAEYAKLTDESLKLMVRRDTFENKSKSYGAVWSADSKLKAAYDHKTLGFVRDMFRKDFQLLRNYYNSSIQLS